MRLRLRSSRAVGEEVRRERVGRGRSAVAAREEEDGAAGAASLSSISSVAGGGGRESVAGAEGEKKRRRGRREEEEDGGKEERETETVTPATDQRGQMKMRFASLASLQQLSVAADRLPSIAVRSESSRALQQHLLHACIQREAVLLRREAGVFRLRPSTPSAARLLPQSRAFMSAVLLSIAVPLEREETYVAPRMQTGCATASLFVRPTLAILQSQPLLLRSHGIPRSPRLATQVARIRIQVTTSAALHSFLPSLERAIELPEARAAAGKRESLDATSASQSVSESRLRSCLEERSASVASSCSREGE